MTSEGRPIGRRLLGRPAAPHQGDEVGVADLGVLARYPEMSDAAAAGDTEETSWWMEMEVCVYMCVSVCGEGRVI